MTSPELSLKQTEHKLPKLKFTFLFKKKKKKILFIMGKN